MARTLQLPIVAGGRLITQPSVGLETVAGTDFTVIRNLFRDFDCMARMPGWSAFFPMVSAAPNPQKTFSTFDACTKMVELVRADGTRVIIGASLNLIKFFDTVTATWITIGTGFSNQGIPWQAVTMSGYAVFNNAVDLPVWWRIGDATVTPLHELRESGIAKVGRIATYNGFLFVGDITEIKADLLPIWMNGPQNYVPTTTFGKSANFTALTTEFSDRYNVTTGSSVIVMTLPATGIGLNHAYYIVTKIDAGSGRVITSPVIETDPVNLTGLNDYAIIQWTGVRWSAWTFPGSVIPPTDPYGIVSPEITERISDEIAWSELGDPTNWAPLLSAGINNAAPGFYLPFRPFNWRAGETRLAVIGGGPDGGVLGGQPAYPEGVRILSWGTFSNFGVPVAIEVTTDTAISYPRNVDVTRFSDLSTFVGKQRMGNGERIVTMLELNGVLIIYQTNGIFITRWTAQVDAPFALRSKYQGVAIPMFGDCIAAVRNSYHLYPSVEGSFIMFDGLTDPVVHDMCELARDLFFEGLLPTHRCWMVDNPTLQTIWIINPSRVMAYRYRRDTPGVSEMDLAGLNSAVFAKRPAGVDDWFVFSFGGIIYQWGLVNGVVTTFLRDGVVPGVGARITSGLNSMRDQMREKTLLSFTPILGGSSPDAAMEVQLRAAWNPSAPMADLLVPVESLPSPMGANFIPCFFQANYFQDEVSLVDTRDIDFRLSARLFEFDVLQGAAPVTRSGNV